MLQIITFAQMLQRLLITTIKAVLSIIVRDSHIWKHHYIFNPMYNGPNYGANYFQNVPLSGHNPVQNPGRTTNPVFQTPQPHQNNNIMGKKHRAMISFVPTKSGNFKAVVKRTRQRTIFSTEQVEALEEIFQIIQYITREERGQIVNHLQINDKAVKIWFQNRRLKDKKDPEQTEDEFQHKSLFKENDDLRDTRLNQLESKINENTDEFGYVTLDNGVMKDLYNVLEDFLTTNKIDVHLNESEMTGSDCSPVDGRIDSDNSPEYEPISPASVSDRTEEEIASSWQPPEHILCDLHSMFS